MDAEIRKLISFLADDCGWPIEDDQIDRSAWPVNNAELGLNDKVAVDSVEIYELRPLTTNQTWGVFFLVVRGTSNLSLTLLRKLLRGLVKKKRASADTSSLQQWNLEDLMFVCSLDEPENTTRYFAHFKEQEMGLPKLMIGARWQDSQPENEIKAAKQKLKSNLKWPDNENDISSWKGQWSKAFSVGHKEVIKTSTDLSKSLAKYAVIIKQNIPEIHSIETNNGPIHKLHEAFRESLIMDLDLDDFADMIAQTVAYGLFTAKMAGVKLTGIESLSDNIPSSNQFLVDLFAEFSKLSKPGSGDLDFDHFALNELIEMLNGVNINSVMSDFGTQFKGGKEDPVIHFYETFLSEYDNQRRIERGVFYTPKPVVNYIVNNINQTLIQDYKLPLGLADTTTWKEMSDLHENISIPNGVSPKQHFVTILDPAVGTGTFLVEVINLIHDTMMGKWNIDGKNNSEKNLLWNDYVVNNLLPRIYGFELMMAPYVIAHLKIGLALSNTGYNFESNDRVQILLTNSLDSPKQLASWIPSFLAKESEIVNKIKTETRFTVILGNPPYSRWSSNLSVEQRGLVEPYRFVDGKRIKERGALQFEINIQDDYVKFFRLCEIAVSKSGIGVIGLITNHGFLDGNSFRGMRCSLYSNVGKIKVINLFGNTKSTTEILRNKGDKNVFDIQQGVSIFISKKNPVTIFDDTVDYIELIGPRQYKYESLVNNDLPKCEKLNPISGDYLFVYRDEIIAKEYKSGIPIDKLFKLTSSGIKTNRDALCISFNRDEAINKGEVFLDKSYSSSKIADLLGIKDKKYWTINNARSDLAKSSWNASIRDIMYRPYDTRKIVYNKSIVSSMRGPVMKEIDGDNLILLTCRYQISPGFYHIFVTNQFFDCCSVSNRSRENTNGFPLYVKDLSGEVISNISKEYGSFIKPGSDLTIDNLFYFIYAQLHSPLYRKRYVENLQRGYPHIFIPMNEQLYFELSNIGKKLVECHLFKNKSPILTTRIGELNLPIEKVTFSDNIIWIDQEMKNGFGNIANDVWNAKIGSYQVVKKWLKDRESKGGKFPKNGRTLSIEDINRFERILNSINSTLIFSKEVDNIINKYGGWEKAFDLSEKLQQLYEKVGKDSIHPNQSTLF